MDKQGAFMIFIMYTPCVMYDDKDDNNIMMMCDDMM